MLPQMSYPLSVAQDIKHCIFIKSCEIKSHYHLIRIFATIYQNTMKQQQKPQKQVTATQRITVWLSYVKVLVQIR